MYTISKVPLAFDTLYYACSKLVTFSVLVQNLLFVQIFTFFCRRKCVHFYWGFFFSQDRCRRWKKRGWIIRCTTRWRSGTSTSWWSTATRISSSPASGAPIRANSTRECSECSEFSSDCADMARIRSPTAILTMTGFAILKFYRFTLTMEGNVSCITKINMLYPPPPEGMHYKSENIGFRCTLLEQQIDKLWGL